MKKSVHDSRMTIFLATAVIAFIAICFVGYYLLSQESSSIVSSEIINAKLANVEANYTEFKNWEKQSSFAGNETSWVFKDGSLYVAYITLGSGLPVTHAKCYKSDENMVVTEIGEFPVENDKNYQYYEGVDPVTCKGILPIQ